MPDVYYHGPALALSLVRSRTPAGDTTTAAFSATSRPGVLKAESADAAAGDVVTILLGSTPIEGGTIENFAGVLWCVPRSRSNPPPVYPIVAGVNVGPLSPTCLVAYRRAAIIHRITTTADLSGKELELVVSTKKDEIKIRQPAASIEGDGNNVVVVELTGEHHNLPAGVYRFGLWEGAYPTGRPWAQGEYIIEPIGGPYVAP